MSFNPDIHHRRSIRLKNFDYSQAGAYFVTICTWQRECLFGDIVDGEMRLNEMGRVVDAVWRALPEHFAGIGLDQHTFMPNHFHGIIVFTDLSYIKVGKKTPMTLDKFEEFFRLLPTCGDSELSWTIDMVARKQTASEEAAPFKQQVIKKEREAAQWSDKAKELRKAKPTDDKAVAEALQKVAELAKEAREQAAKAEEIENAVYDLKAVNPNAKAEEDKRTPEQLLNFIEAKGREIVEALAVLRGDSP